MKTNKKIIGLCGFIGSGKDTVAEYLITQHNFTKLSFAKTLKDVLSVMFLWDRTLLDGITTESRIWRETTDQWWSTKLNIPNFTPRLAMQLVGTDSIRNHFNENMWVLSLEKQISQLDSNIVISDCRYKNEINLLKNLDSTMIIIERDSKPVWYDHAIKAILGDYDSEYYMHQHKIHSSEWDWLETKFDYSFSNNLSVAHLQQQIETMLLNG